MSPSSAARSKPRSTAWSRLYSGPPAPSGCTTPSTASTRWPMWATSRALLRRSKAVILSVAKDPPPAPESLVAALGPSLRSGRQLGARMSEDFRTRARLIAKGNRYEDFEPGRVFKHHWGRTVTESESTLFSTLTLHFNPHYFNAAYARAHGHPGLVVNPLLVFTTVFGLTVEDLSEGGGPFLGVNQLTYHQPVYPGDSLRAESEVLDRRVSDSHKGFGIVTWHSKGLNQRDELAIDFKRTNLVRLRNP